jgi:two-component system, cell cycle sensor histidine kinase and response regulator CckA
MLPDLATLLLLRLGVDVLIAFAFLGLMRRYPAIGGPGWWSLGSLLAILGSLALMMRVSAADPPSRGLDGGLLLFGSAMPGLGGPAQLPALGLPLGIG